MITSPELSEVPGKVARVRKSFPYLHERIYLDTASAGLSWSGHGAAVSGFFDDHKARGIDAQSQWRDRVSRTRDRLGDYLKMPSSRIALLSNTTEALNLAAHSLHFQTGDQIVLAEDEFPSVQHVWSPALARGAELVRVPIEREDDRMTRLMQAIGPKTRLVAVSHTHSSTGTTLDLDQLGTLCRSRNALLLVDGIQALGAVPPACQMVDLYCASFFKWMLSGFGIAVLGISERARERLTAAYRGYANLDDLTGLQYAHVNMPGIYGLSATLDYLEQTEWPWIYGRVSALGKHLIEGCDRMGLDLVTPRSCHAGIFVIRSERADRVREHLATQGISVSVRGAGIRISPHFYNTSEEIDQCLSALVEGTRFSP